MEFELKIEGKYINEMQRWRTSGTDKAGNLILTNLSKYTSDATLTMDDSMRIIDGYEFIFNPGNKITATKIDDVMIDKR